VSTPGNRLDARLAALRAAGRKALATYCVAGDPTPAATVPVMHALVAGGASVLELGIPFTDPEADGPVIQAAHERALAAGMTLSGVLDLVRQFRARDGTTPVLLMGYLNCVERMGCAAFAERAAAAGVDAVLLTNLPPEEASPLSAALAAAGIRLVLLLAPTTTDARARRIAAAASGFLYYVSLKGITGALNLAAGAVAERIGELRAVTDLPILVGFGIRDADSARAVSRAADGVVIGTAVVERMVANQRAGKAPEEGLATWARGIRESLDGG
jgi:tryptophan synthase alpha chain